MKMPRNDIGSTDYCLDCIANMTIRCAWCGGPIFIGSPVTLYLKQEGELPEHAVAYIRQGTSHRQVVGCLSAECTDTFSDCAGHWMPGPDGLGRVDMMPTIFERILGQEAGALTSIREGHDATSTHAGTVREIRTIASSRKP